MAKLSSLFVVLSVIVSACTAQEPAFAELDDVFNAYVAAMKSNDDAVLMEFCMALTPDDAMENYMDAHRLCYRGIPCQMAQEGVNRQYLAETFFDGLVRVRDRVRAANLLDGLVHVDSTTYRWEYVVFINVKAPGTDYIVDQMSSSLSMARYAALEAEATAQGITLEDLLLDGKNGEVVIVRGTEDEMQLSSGEFRIAYSMGELVCVNKRWLLFTKPRPDYSVDRKAG
jgi:hypothetical protein